MSRIRSIKPEFFLDEELAELSPLTRLLFVGLWTLADCEGRLEDRPKRIRAQLHPYDDGDTDAMLQALHDARFIKRYSVNGVRYLEIRSFKKHQRLSGKEADGESALPGPIESNFIDNNQINNIEATGKQRGSNGEAANVQEGKGIGKEGKGIGNEGSVSAQARSARTTSTPLPPDFEIGEQTRDWAERNGYDRLPDHLEAFKGKALAKGYRYADWQQAFRNAIRDDWAGLRKPAAVPGGGREPGQVYTPATKHAALAEHNSAVLSQWLDADSAQPAPIVLAHKELAHATH